MTDSTLKLLETLSDNVRLVSLETAGGECIGIRHTDAEGNLKGIKWFASIETAKREAEKDFL